MYYNRHRCYDPEICQYISPDPIGMQGGLLPQAYVHNPLEWVDPLGLSDCSTQEYEVGTFNELKRRSKVGDELDIHHAVQKHPASQIIANYDSELAPSIALSNKEHKLIGTFKGSYTGTARDLLAKDMWDLRRYTNAPSSAIRKLIKLNKKMFPDAFIKKR